ncbi:phosphoribosylglycinamide formyltransferase [Corynebacterium kroppenstedtii]|uniref:phosphoribosylglycinamide formyltransferase n=1 Tax=Corynebacterium sp. PCR 32 TaxID=3351342 RepID=UPI0030A87DF7
MRIVILASGTGTLLHSVMDNIDPTRVDIAAVGSDRECEALNRAQQAGLATFLVGYVPGSTDRAAWNDQFASVISRYQPDLIVCAGFMRILGTTVVNAFPGMIINTHPALLPSFPGAHGVRDALNYGVKVTGTTVHVVDAGVDSGPILAQRPVVVDPQDTEASLHEKIKKVERVLLVDVIHDIADGNIETTQRAPGNTIPTGQEQRQCGTDKAGNAHTAQGGAGVKP